MVSFTAEFTESVMYFALEFTENLTSFDVDFGEIQVVTGEGIPYSGEYTVTPKVTEQVLPTAHTLMEDDLTVKSIPFFNVSNTAGGSSVYIGNEV